MYIVCNGEIDNVKCNRPVDYFWEWQS